MSLLTVTDGNQFSVGYSVVPALIQVETADAAKEKHSEKWCTARHNGKRGGAAAAAEDRARGEERQLSQ